MQPRKTATDWSELDEAVSEDEDPSEGPERLALGGEPESPDPDDMPDDILAQLDDQDLDIW